VKRVFILIELVLFLGVNINWSYTGFLIYFILFLLKIFRIKPTIPSSQLCGNLRIAVRNFQISILIKIHITLSLRFIKHHTMKM
jgi:hypothetical protein